MSDNEPRREPRRHHTLMKPVDMDGQTILPGTEMILTRIEFDSFVAIGAMQGAFEDGRADHPDDDAA